ncbi:MAG: NusG domain II-containing protein [Clostridia bacterium]|nr:NusG domain II-containing protein [Clostridia bacterium]
MKKGDIVIIVSVALAFVASIVLLVSFSKQGNRVVIKQDNKIIYDDGIVINNTVKTEHNTITIKNGKVYMSHSDCKNQICVGSGKIEKKGESIVCLPNKVTVEIK